MAHVSRSADVQGDEPGYEDCQVKLTQNGKQVRRRHGVRRDGGYVAVTQRGHGDKALIQKGRDEIAFDRKIFETREGCGLKMLYQGENQRKSNAKQQVYAHGTH